MLLRTVRAFSELRQLQALLESLGAAMRAVAGTAVYGSVVAGLLVRSEVLAALRQAVTSAPSGEYGILVREMNGAPD